MLINRFIRALLALTALTLATAGWSKSAEQWMEEMGVNTNLSYQAIRVMETKDGQFEMTERVAPQKRAMEMDMGGMKGTMVMREDQNRAFFTMPSMGMYRDMKMTEAMKQSNQNMDVSNVEKVGRETISGFETTKFKTQFKDANGKGAGFIWVADEGFPIKMDMIYKSRGMKGERMTMTMRDIKIGPQDPSHFEIPPGLKPFGLGAAMGQYQTVERASGTGQANQMPSELPPPAPEPGLGEEMGEAVKDEAKHGVIQGTREGIRQGIRGLFRR